MEENRSKRTSQGEIGLCQCERDLDITRSQAVEMDKNGQKRETGKTA
jgi:hypothetical protein